tara:strand:- start:558 stop:1349 length:792 start_codon:yes stop_codon:yes gene_type:complete
MSCEAKSEEPPSRNGTDEAVVIVKAAPQIGKKHGETVCCAAIDLYGRWLRLYPVSFRTLEDGQSFKRWDKIKFGWRRPKDDPRSESRRINQDSLEITGTLRKSERERFLSGAIVESLSTEREEGKSFALLKPNVQNFFIERKNEGKIAREKESIEQLNSQQDLFNSAKLIPREPCPYQFKYQYSDADSERTATCQDWETEATFFKWRNLYGEEKALEEMKRVFGEEYPRKGMLFAMGTHSLYPDTWLMNGIIRLDDVKQATLF